MPHILLVFMNKHEVLTVLSKILYVAQKTFVIYERVLYLQLIPLTIIYVAMAITGIIGNVSVCWVILRIPYMRSATNYYLFSLAVSDLLILLLGNLSSSKKFLGNFIHKSKSWFFSMELCVLKCGFLSVHFNKS